MDICNLLLLSDRSLVSIRCFSYWPYPTNFCVKLLFQIPSPLASFNCYREWKIYCVVSFHQCVIARGPFCATHCITFLISPSFRNRPWVYHCAHHHEDFQLIWQQAHLSWLNHLYVRVRDTKHSYLEHQFIHYYDDLPSNLVKCLQWEVPQWTRLQIYPS